jgi:3-hydroxyisobutyrate dehydrogenase-like beta-hydroxyacid dehydrogenase
MTDMTIGFVGLGNMGFPMAGCLLKAGYQVVGCDISPETRKRFTELGGTWAETPRDVANRCRVVLASLPTPQAVERVALGDNGVMGGDAIRIFIDLSTTGPRTAKAVAARLALQGIAAMDAPVSGGVYSAVKGALTVMLSGPEDARAEIEPILKAIGKNVFYVGTEAGMGQLMKLINNLLSATALAATCETMALGIKSGLDPQVMLSVLNASTGVNSATQQKIPQCVLPGKPIGFGMDLGLKDVSLCVEEGEAMGIPMWVGNTTRQLWHHALSTGGDGQDLVEVARTFEKWAGVKLYGAVPEQTD